MKCEYSDVTNILVEFMCSLAACKILLISVSWCIKLYLFFELRRLVTYTLISDNFNVTKAFRIIYVKKLPLKVKFPVFTRKGKLMLNFLVTILFYLFNSFMYVLHPKNFSHFCMAPWEFHSLRTALLTLIDCLPNFYFLVYLTYELTRCCLFSSRPFAVPKIRHHPINETKLSSDTSQ